MTARISFIVMLVALLAACSTKPSRLVSNTYDFLYPDEEARKIEPQSALLEIPIRVGLAFAPTTQEHSRWAIGENKVVSSEDLPATTKQKLLESIAAAFRERDYIASIEVIPDAYLREKGGFDNLDQLQTMYDIDVMALVSYDQLQTTGEGFASLAYWTVVGAYVVSGEENTTTTLMDTVVFDIESRRMLFRAPGLSEIQDSSTLIEHWDALREDSEKGFEAATAQMITNLDAELDRFKEKIKQQPENFRVEQAEGYTGGGGSLALLLLPLAFIGFRR